MITKSQHTIQRWKYAAVSGGRGYLAAFMAVGLLLGASVNQAAPFVLSGDGQEATDTATGLIWRRCLEGMTWNGSTCNNAANFYTHEQAFQRATSQATLSNAAWRLPNVKELETLLIENPPTATLVDAAIFPNTPPDLFWTSTPYASDGNGVWVVDFSVGVVAAVLRSNINYLRLVR